MTSLNDLNLAPPEFDYSIIQAIYPGEVTGDILDFVHQYIEDKDVYKDEDIPGKENKPHITILYGIKEQKPNIEKITQVLQNHPAMATVDWVGLGKFEAATHDVLFIAIESDEAAELFRDFNQLYPDNANSHPNYKPHTTLAYLQKGMADKYIEQFGSAFVEQGVKIQWIRFAYNDNLQDFCPVEGTPREQ